jgi:hypothetical protein
MSLNVAFPNHSIVGRILDVPRSKNFFDVAELLCCHATATLKEIPYGKWREYDPEDAVRFFALRMRDVGMIKTSPQKIVAEGTDWRFLNELKKELKG